jgi:NADPH:quinone reductase-like Zn-dependent oxidoreductase
MVGIVKTMIVAKFVSQKLVIVMAHTSAADLTTLADLMQSGKLKSVIDRRYPLDQVADAVRYQETEHARGKVAVTVD